MEPRVGINAVMSELDLTHLDVIHDHHGDAFGGEPSAMARELVFVGVTALTENHGKRAWRRCEADRGSRSNKSWEQSRERCSR